MKLKSFLWVIATFLTINVVVAATPNSNDINKQIQTLEKQVQILQTEAKQLPVNQQEVMERQIKSLEMQIEQMKQEIHLGFPYKLNGWAEQYFPQAPFVLTSSYLGTRAAYDASDLITNWPSINEDLAILEQRQQMVHILESKGLPLPDRPLINLSGYVEGKAAVYNNYNNHTGEYSKHTTGDINLSGAELDILGQVSPWATAYMVLSYDNYPPDFGYRAYNSRIYVDRGFLTLGNLDKLPIYGTIGQMLVPFGVYDSFMISDPSIKTLARTKQRAMLLGFSKYGLYASTYAMAGDSYVSHNQTINNWGVNLGYKFKISQFSSNISAGYLQNLADSEGIQGTGAPDGYFQGFAYDSDGSGDKHENLQHQVPAIDVHANFSFSDHYHIYAEYISALRAFSPVDLKFNDHGAKPSALNTEFGLKFDICGRPSTFAAGYEQTWQSLGLNLPQYTFITTIGTSIWRDTIEKIEYRHDWNYNAKNTSAGGGSMDMHPTGPHNYKNVLTFQMDFYF